MVARLIEIDEVLDAPALARTHAAVRSVPHFEMLAQAPRASGFGTGLVERHDVVREFLRSGGLSRRPVELCNLADRVNFFRATLAYQRRIEHAGIEAYLGAERLAAAAREIYDCAIVEPAIVFVNLAVPGQEIGVHTDVPEFRGLSRDHVPEWLLVVMHHSGLFAADRLAIATGVSWFGHSRGGDFCCWPDAIDRAPKRVAIADNRGVVLDTDSVFHAVAPIEWTRGRSRPLLEVGARIRWLADRGAWVVEFRGNELAELAADDVRISISWKAWCFAGEAERERARAGVDGLELTDVLTRLRRDLADRGRLPSAEAELRDTELALLLIDEYVRFPTVVD